MSAYDRILQSKVFTVGELESMYGMVCTVSACKNKHTTVQSVLALAKTDSSDNVLEIQMHER